jgi:hypothetical protein
MATPDPAKKPARPITTHGSERLTDAKEFFAAPPDEIGEVITADSTLRKGVRPMAAGMRLFVICLASLVGGGLGLGLAILCWGSGSDAIGGQAFLTLLFGAVAALAAWGMTRFKHTCSFVAKDGVASFTCVGNADNVTVSRVFLFENATDLRTGKVSRYVNGVYQGTNYTYTWTDENGKTQFKLNGTFRSKAGTPPAKHPYYFATSAENAWSEYLLDHLQAELEEHGSIQFNLGGRDYVRVGRGFVELNVKGQKERLDTADIGGVSIGNGIFKVRRKGAKEGWFSSDGVYQFTYSSMANATLFLLALDRLVGIRFR